MKKFLTVLCLCFVSIDVSAATYACIMQEKETLMHGRLSAGGTEFLYCGHVEDKGCDEGDVVKGDRENVANLLWKCHNHHWIKVGESEIRDCSLTENLTNEAVDAVSETSKYVLYGESDMRKLHDGEEVKSWAIKGGIAGVCKINLAEARKECEKSGGTLEGRYCNCSKDGYAQGANLTAPCECADGLKRGADNKCWPAQYVDGKCLVYLNHIYDCPLPDVGHEVNGILFTYLDKYRCSFVYKDSNYYRLCNDNGKIIKKIGVACPGFDDELAWNAYGEGRYNQEEDKDGFPCIKPKPESKYNYKSCSADSDCTGIDNTVRPYLHSTAWHCAWQSAGVRVCAATACESGWTPINGYCQEDKTAQTPQSENKNANSVSNIKTETKAGTKKPCTDLDNMDSNCKCIVVGTVERGGKCVCRDDNQEIKNGKCEWTAKYIAGLESDLDSKFNNLTATIGGFEKNVWRDENGEFNTARLASDSIAGIVLGTVGGIVTANLVKKAQVKQGFEDIGCYIGGQSVAGFGDEFNVGR